MADDEGQGEPGAGGLTHVEPLSRWQRIGSGALGAAALGTGGASVFLTTNQAGSVALMAVGSSFLLMSVTGAPIGRVKFSNSELAMLPTRGKEQAHQGPDEFFAASVAQARELLMDSVWVVNAAVRSEDRTARVLLGRRALLDACLAAVFGSLPGNAWQQLDERPVSPDALRRLLIVRSLINDPDLALSPADLAPAILQMYQTIERISRRPGRRLRRSLLGVAALYAEFYGWMRQELGDLRGAQAWTEHALEQAQAANNGEASAYMYIRLSQLAEAGHAAIRAVELARRAQYETGLSAPLRAQALQQEAHGHALAGATKRCLDALERCRAVSLPLCGDLTEEYRVGQFFDGRRQELQRASTLLDLGFDREAIRGYEQNSQWLAGMCGWERSVHTAKLARAYARTGDVERAAMLGSQALELSLGCGFKTTERELRKLSTWNAEPGIAQVTSQLRP